MKTKTNLILFGMLFFGLILSAQEWQQTASTPEGGGITELVVNPTNGHIFVTTSSFDYPFGDNGGIRRSTDDGDTWENLVDVYTGRTISFCADGNLYASYWPYPAHEGLYRSVDNGNTWELLTMIAYGNNIFAVAVNTLTNPHTIFAGTRNGVWRSIDNGANWAWANEGIPWATWIRDIEVDSSGMVVAGTTCGILCSEDNGDLWEQATGAGIENDTITKIIFDYPLDSKDYLSRLLAGSNTGNVYESFGESKYLMATMLEIFNGEASGVFVYMLKAENKKMHGISTFPKGTQPGGFNYSTDDGTSWQQNNSGLPGTSLPISALSGNSTSIDIRLKLGLFEDMNGGAKVFKTTYDWSSIVGIEDQKTLQPGNFDFSVYPNPCAGLMHLQIQISEQGNVIYVLFDLSGTKVISLAKDNTMPGTHTMEIDLSDIPSGIYFCVLKTNEGVQTKKLIKLN